jgi:hypothetical protein
LHVSCLILHIHVSFSVSISTSNTVQTFRKTKTAPQVHSDYPDLYTSEYQTCRRQQRLELPL